MPSGKAKIAGVIGWPVAHSLSPKLHNYWLKKYGIDGEYLALAVEPKDLETVIKTLPEMGWQGCNLTIPHKEAALSFLDEIDDIAWSVGAVNTVIVKDGKLFGMNTDVYGFTKNIEQQLKGRNKAVVLGAGGAAKAVWKALLDMDFGKIVTLNRNHDRATLSQKLGNRFTAKLWEDRSSSAILENADLLVNATSLGLGDNDPLDIDLSSLPMQALVTDIVYTPLMTPLLQLAKARGNPIVDGLGMLLHQAVPAFEAWFGVRPEVSEEVRRHIVGESA